MIAGADASPATPYSLTWLTKKRETIVNEGNLRHFLPGNRANPVGRPKGWAVRAGAGWARTATRSSTTWSASSATAGAATATGTRPRVGSPINWGGRPGIPAKGGHCLPDLLHLQVVLVQALSPLPEARVAVAQALALLEPGTPEDGA